MSELFYCHTCGEGEHVDISGMHDLRFVLWRPSWRRVIPSGLPLFPFAVWWVFHWVRLFGNRDYSIVLAYDGERLIHRSCVFPCYFRFPFMASTDLQIGDTWTDSNYRGRGIAKVALQEAVHRHACPSRRFWYVVDHENPGSVNVAKKMGFRLVGEGHRTSPFGLRVLGGFEITRIIEST